MNKFKRYLSSEIGIEFKASLYFFFILFFYCVYKVINGSLQADIIIMTEMIATTYIMGYIQVFLLRNFEETEKVGLFEVLACIGCSLVYVIESYICNWFEKDLLVTGIFAAYMVFGYFCMIAVYYVKRHFDTEVLNNDLDDFKSRRDLS